MRPDNTRWIAFIIVAGVIGAVLGPSLGRSMSGGTALIVFALFFIAIIGFVVWSLSANKVGKPASAEMTAKARTLTPAPGTARIYVVRRGFMGGMAGMKVSIPGVASGQIRMNQFVMAEVQPGTYTIETAMARNGVKPSNSETTLTLHAGETAVMLAMLQVEAMHAVTTQQRILGAEAQKEITGAKLVHWNEASPGEA